MIGGFSNLSRSIRGGTGGEGGESARVKRGEDTSVFPPRAGLPREFAV